jgi:hypothetical protein
VSWGPRSGASGSAHIYTRNRGQGEDKRYASLLRRNRESLPAFVLHYIYWMQGRVIWFVSLPVQAAMHEHAGWAWFRGWVRRCGRWGSASRRSGTRSCAGSGPTRPTPGGCSTAGYGATPGTRLLEKHMVCSEGAAYAEYVRRTRGFIPARRVERMGRWPAKRYECDWCRYYSTDCTHTRWLGLRGAPVG